jgi:hypothetical protein
VDVSILLESLRGIACSIEEDRPQVDLSLLNTHAIYFSHLQ